MCISFFFSFPFYLSFFSLSPFLFSLKLRRNEMSLIYGLVARGSTILAEHTNSSGNFATGKKISPFAASWR
jgi:hypothetical protein